MAGCLFWLEGRSGLSGRHCYQGDEYRKRNRSVLCDKYDKKICDIVCVPNWTWRFHDFINGVDQVLGAVFNKFLNYRVVICGDFNVYLLVESRERYEFLDLLKSYNIEQTVFQPTQISRDSETLLGNILVNFENCDGNTVVLPGLSDHAAQLITLS
ncbi:hypothetical protein HHI36_016693, partial [Cryptolaemus montrouzieri]